MPVPILACPRTCHWQCVRTGQTVRGTAAVPPRLAKNAITGASRLPVSPWPRRGQLASHQAVKAPPWRRVGRLPVVTPAAVAVPAGGRPKESRASRGFKAKLNTLLTPFSDHQANSKLLALCTAQMLGSISTLMHEVYMPVYLSEVLHLSNTKIGNLQGLSQLLSKVSGSVSGTLADLLTPAKMVIFGILLTSLTKPMFALSGSVHALLGTTACLLWITCAKLLDRLSKGVREAPSKALISELAAQSGDSAAAAFSLRQSLATAGALLGGGVATLAFKLSGGNYVLTFALACVPAVVALLLVISAFGGGRGEVAAPGGSVQSASAASGASDDSDAEVGQEVQALGVQGKAQALLGALSPAYWQALATVCILYMARFDQSFPTLRAMAVVNKASLPLLLALTGVPFAVLATPAGLYAKRSTRARNTVLLLGISALIAADLCYAFVLTVPGMMLGALLCGIHMAMTHGVSIAMISAYIPTAPIPGIGKIVGTAWSFTDLLLGVVLASANLLAGHLSDWTVQLGLGNIGCFLGGAAACTLSMAALLLFSTFGHLGKDELLPVKTKKA